MTISPYILEFCVAGIGIIILLWEAFMSPKNKSLLGAVGALSLGVICVLMLNCLTKIGISVPTDAPTPGWMQRFYVHDGFARIFKIIALLSTILMLLMTFDFKSILNKFTSENNSDKNTGEFYSLPIFACAGMMWMASARDLVSIFVSLELVTICFYIMVAYLRRNVGSLEAGVKYLILGALSTGILVYGIAWLYGSTQTTNLAVMESMLVDGSLKSSPSLLFGLALIIIALAFKVGAVPMQLWIPDVYQGAPMPITAFLSVASKAAGFALAVIILRPFLEQSAVSAQVRNIILILAAATLIYGNFAATGQKNFKRILAYSSIAHAGFLLIALALGAYTTIIFYLVTYLIMTFAAFFVLNIVRAQRGDEELSTLDGLGKTNPGLALILTISIAAMAGIPLTAGFWGKFMVFSSAISSQSVSWSVIIIAFIGVAAGFYYYFKAIRAMYWHSPQYDAAITISRSTRIVLLILTMLTIIAGFYPQFIMDLIGNPQLKSVIIN